MNLVLILLIFAVASVLIVPSYAQTSSILVFTHVELRDSQGHLVSSFTPTKIGYINENELHNFLNYESTLNDQIKNVNNQKIQIIQREGVLNFDSKNIIPDTTLNTSLDNVE